MSSSHCTDGQWDWKTTQPSVPASEEQHMQDSFPGRSGSCYVDIQKLELRSTMKKKFDRLKLEKIALLPSSWLRCVLLPTIHSFLFFLFLFFTSNTKWIIHSFLPPNVTFSCEALYYLRLYPFTCIYTYRLSSRVCMWGRAWKTHSLWVWVTSEIVKRKGLMVGEVKHLGGWGRRFWYSRPVLAA